MSNRVCVKSSDSHIWDGEIVATEIAYKIGQYGSIIIDLNLEAPDISTTELKNILDCLSDNGVEYNQIEIHTGNILESYDRFKVVKHVKWMYELEMFQQLSNSISKEKKIKKHFGCFVGRSNITRLILASHLWTNYADKTLLTYHFTPGHDFHRAHLGLENIIYYFGIHSQEYCEAIKLLNVAPLKIEEKKSSYPIVNQHAIINPCTWYKDIFVDIVCETFSNGNVFFLTEKFWRAVATKTPFIIQGSQFTIRRLKQLGFKTFNCWWDEGYDEDPYLYSQTEIKKVLAHLSVLSIYELEQMYSEMKSNLEHNYNLMMQLTYKDFEVVK